MLQSLLRTLIMYAVILLAVRIMGKRQISQLQTSELVVTLLISELAVMPIQARNESLWTGLVPMAVLVLCEIVMSLLMLKSGKFRQTVCGKPVLVIENGQILQTAMRKLRMSIEDLYEQLRQNGVFTIEDVAFAVIETNGNMSVSLRPESAPLTPEQAGIPVEGRPLEVVVVSDGEISENSLRLCGKDSAWVREQLRTAGLTLPQVFLMTACRTGPVHIIPREKEL